MADAAKLKIKIGNIAFSGEGDNKWLAEQLDKILDRASELVDIPDEVDHSDDGDQGGADNDTKSKVTLSKFLKDAKATTNQTVKFLATAAWLDARDGKVQKRTTSDVTKALDGNHQGSLTNASQSLNNNVTKGFCEKKDGQFYVTDEGRSSLAK